MLDSGSTDKTLEIAEKYGTQVKYNKFVNHPKQWDFALSNFDIKTPWIIGLDADQIVLSELFEKLKSFKNEEKETVTAILVRGTIAIQYYTDNISIHRPLLLS